MKHWSYYSLITIILLTTQLGFTQGHQPIFPSLQGEDLEIALQDSFRPTQVLDYSQARDTLFKLIDSRNDTVYGIYSKLGIYLPPDQDPTEFLFMNGAANGINTEHSWPRSKGARNGNANSDMHHLFPSRTPVNADRGSLPFGESNDSQTRKWYYETETRTTIPTERDLYSELGNNIFEPREASKGNIARACFYFYTIYREEAIQADPTYFEIQRSDLCQWHLDDPIDQEEWERSSEIAHYQNGKGNPFILDCTLAHRTYCPEFDECVPVTPSKSVSVQEFRVYPNPTHDFLQLDLDVSNSSGRFELFVTNLQGQRLIKREVNALELQRRFRFNLPKGMYLIHIRDYSLSKLYISKFYQN